MADSSVRTAAASGEPEKKQGWLLKWTNYLRGYQRRWFVLSNGNLSYYKSEAEMAHTCRGTISLLNALIHTADACTFVISTAGTHVFHIRARDEVERQSWVTALELAKARAIQATESDEEEEGSRGARETQAEDAALTGELTARLSDLSTCSDIVVRHGAVLQRSLADLDLAPSDAARQLSERITLYRIACTAMMKACSEFMSAAQASTNKLSRALQHEREQKMRLQEVVEQLARQHDNLEKTVTARNAQPGGASHHDTDEDEEHEFFDAQDDATASSPHPPHAPHPPHPPPSFIMQVPVNRKTNKSTGESSDESETETLTETQQVLFVEESGSRMGGTEPTGETSSETDGAHHDTTSQHQIWPHVSKVASVVEGRPRRCSVPDKPNYPLNLWSIMSNCIGKDLSKIPIPVNFSEPLSMLQRLTEDYEYSNILDAAYTCSDPAQQLAYVAAFTVSSYATTACRTNKPFNPLLGETYECDRMSDLGWRAVSEQVSHHPPMLAQYCESAVGWRCWQEFTMTSKFRGKYLQIIPHGGAQAYFPQSGNKYSWRKVTTTVHNIILGKLWVDNHGDMVISGDEGPATGYTADLRYQPYSYFNKDTQRKVYGVVKDPFGTPKYVIQGRWDSRVEVAPVTSTSEDQSVCKTGKSSVVWERVPAPSDSDKWYNFTLLAAQLNEPERGVAPTDSRNRPDQRLMEQGLWDEANKEKVRLEEKQRSKRREHEAAAEGAAARGLPPPPGPQPVWFTCEALPSPHPSQQPTLRHVFKGDYWLCKEQQDWSRCPDIF